METIKTERLTLRRFTPEDLDDLHEILGNPAVMKHSEPPYTRERAAAFLRDFCVNRTPPAAFAACENQGGKVIGYLLFKEGEAGVYEAGWFFNESRWGRGLAYEAVSALFAYAFDALGAHKITAETTDPRRSLRLMERLGMCREGVQRSQTRGSDGEWADVYWYGLL